MKIKNIIKFLLNSEYRFLVKSVNGYYKEMPDEEYLKKKFKGLMGYPLNIESPTTFNEKLQWLKLYNRKDEYTTMVDKYAAKKYVADIIGEQYIIPTYGVWENFSDIDFESLPNQFVLKCTHNSGGLIICRDKKSFNKKSAKKKIEKSLKVNYYWRGREWPYKNVKPRIIAEKYMDDNGHVPADYKIYCFNGEPYKVMVCVDRDKDEPTKFYSFDWEWNLLRHNKWGKLAKDNTVCSRPHNLSKMYEIAKILSKDIPFVRVDLYEVEKQIYFGELTFFPDDGFDKNINPEIDKLYGDMIKLDSVKDKETK